MERFNDVRKNETKAVSSGFFDSLYENIVL